jgi:asparagine synthase (glutamine-hydrolysing)
MCGIAGIFAYHHAALPVDRVELRTVRDHMIARGPNGSGEWFSADGDVAFGHRRLSIIDLSDRATQPMASPDGQFIVSFNGEIYNYRELKKELEAKGRVFRTTSDTEVLLHLYAEKGAAMLADLRGMFAFALWDARKHAVLLARDPYGIKPLYCADDGRTVRFASQVKALLASSKVSRTPDPAGLAGFYLLGSVPEPYTLYQQIRSVPAGSYQWIDATGLHPAVPYFSLAEAWAGAAHGNPMAPLALQATIRDAMLDSVRHHMVADVPVGAFLSAGIDSGALVGLMKDAGQTDIQTVTLAFAEYRGKPQDEAPLAELVAKLYGVRHTTRVVGEAEFQQDLPRILAAMDQPSIDGINTWFVSKAAAEIGLKVAVSGVGGDELLGGYPSFRDIPRWMRLMWLPSRVPGLAGIAEQLQAAFPLFRGHPKAVGMLRYGRSFAGAYLLRRGLFLPNELPALIGADVAREGLQRLQPIAHIAGTLTGLPTGNAFAQVATLESALYMRNQLLRDTDWASMAHSLEVRTPLVDATLLQGLVGPLRANNLSSYKQFLAASPLTPLPDEVARRAKSGFTTPVSNWQQRNNSTQAWRLKDLLAMPSCPWARRWSFVVASASAGYKE